MLVLALYKTEWFSFQFSSSCPWRGKIYLYSYSLSLLAIYCPKLSLVKFATVQPPECVTQPIKFGRTCQFRCPDGYFTDDDLHETTAYFGCLHNGTWDVQVPNCVGKYFFLSFSFSLFGKIPFWSPPSSGNACDWLKQNFNQSADRCSDTASVWSYWSRSLDGFAKCRLFCQLKFQRTYHSPARTIFQ